MLHNWEVRLAPQPIWLGLMQCKAQLSSAHANSTKRKAYGSAAMACTVEQLLGAPAPEGREATVTLLV